MLQIESDCVYNHDLMMEEYMWKLYVFIIMSCIVCGILIVEFLWKLNRKQYKKVMCGKATIFNVIQSTLFDSKKVVYIYDLMCEINHETYIMSAASLKKHENQESVNYNMDGIQVRILDGSPEFVQRKTGAGMIYMKKSRTILDVWMIALLMILLFKIAISGMKFVNLLAAIGIPVTLLFFFIQAFEKHLHKRSNLIDRINDGLLYPVQAIVIQTQTLFQRRLFSFKNISSAFVKFNSNSGMHLAHIPMKTNDEFLVGELIELEYDCIDHIIYREESLKFIR